MGGIPFYNYGSWGPEILRHCLKVTQLGTNQNWNWGGLEFKKKTPSQPSGRASILLFCCISPWVILSISQVRSAPHYLPRCLFHWGRISALSISIAALDTENCLEEHWLPSPSLLSPQHCPLLPNPGPFPPVKGRHLLSDTNLQPSQVWMRFLIGLAAHWLQARME